MWFSTEIRRNGLPTTIRGSESAKPFSGERAPFKNIQVEAFNRKNKLPLTVAEWGSGKCL